MSTFTRRGFLGAAALAGMAGAGSTVLSGCAQVTGKSNGSGSGAPTVLTIGAETGSDNKLNQFPHNFNVFGGGNSAPGTGFFYETLFRIGQTSGAALIPCLAESAEFNSDGSIETYHLRKDVTWSDGKPFTAEDVAFTYNFIYGPPGKKGSDAFVTKACEALDDHTVRVWYTAPSVQEDVNLSNWYPIYPKHIYEKVDHQKYVDENPVGTGPGRLKSFQSGRIEIEVREDYWAGKSPVKSIVIVPQGTAGNIQSQISQGKADWADGGTQGVLTTFLKQNPDNRYKFWPDGSATGVLFNCTEGPTNDKYVRTALRAAIDPVAIQKAVGIGAPIPAPSGLDTSIYAGWLVPGHDQPIAQDLSAAKQALSDGGWTVSGGNLTKGGKSYPISLMVNLGQPTHVVAGPMIIAQWESALGLKVEQVSKADQVFQKQSVAHKYSTMLWSVTFNGSAYSAYQGYSWENLGDKQQAAGYGNSGLWKCPASMNDALTTLQGISPTEVDKMKTQVQVIQQAVIDEAPFAPVMGGGQGEMTTVKNWDGWPDMGQSTYRPVATVFYSNMVQTLMNLKPA